MKPQEKLKFFWATGILPGTMFDDLDDKKFKQPVQPRRRQASWLRRLLG